MVPDQLVDRTRPGAEFYDKDAAVHVQFADPYCPVGRSRAVAAARSAGWVPASSGTLVVIDGPRFSTRAESRWYAAQGWTLIGMTAHPEAVLARELALCYTTIALVTDTDAGVEEGEGVTHAEVFRVFGENIGRLRDVLRMHRGAPRGPRLPGPARARRPGVPHPATLDSPPERADPPPERRGAGHDHAGGRSAAGSPLTG